MKQKEEKLNKGVRYNIEPPKNFDVIFLNDNVTTMEYVVMVLMEVFYKTQEEAFRVMMKIHKEGSAVVGTYSYDLALTKKKKVDGMSKANGFPLEVIVKETID